MNTEQRQEAARKRPLMRQPTEDQLREYAARERKGWDHGVRPDLRTREERAIDDRIARAARRRRHQNRGKP